MGSTVGRSVTAITESARDIPVVANVDVLVVGGGPAGVGAAVGSARTGAHTMLVERYGFLGGMWTAGMVVTLGGFNSWLRPYWRCVGGVASDWLTRAATLKGAEDNQSWVLNSDPETMKLVADQLMEEGGVEVLFHAWGARPIVENRSVHGLFVENVSGRQAILASVVVDCTGNGDIAAQAGAPFEKRVFLQPMTLTFRLGNVSTGGAGETPALIPIGPAPCVLTEPLLSQYTSRRRVSFDRQAMLTAHQRGELPVFGGPWFGGLEGNVLWVNATRIYGDACNARNLSRAEMEGRRDVRELVDYFRRFVPGFSGVRLLETGTQVGVRETRRIVGEYVITDEDIRKATYHDDTVAVGCWPIDVHPHRGVSGLHSLYVPLPYGIPYRCLIPKGIDNLLVAGRCISATAEAMGSIRIGATCAALGHAAGVAAGIAAKRGLPVRHVDHRYLRDVLRTQGAVLESKSR